MVMRRVLRVRFGTWIIVPQKLLWEMAKSSWKVHWVFHWLNRFLWRPRILATYCGSSMESYWLWSLTYTCMHAQLLQPCLTLCNPMFYNPPGSSVHGISQARILEWVVISFSRDLPDPGIKPESLASPVLAGGFFRVWDIWVLIVALQITCYVALGISCSFSEPLFSNL